ncbi:MAG: energy transducer TonB [candidate division WOR-3 bacterium]
MMPEQKKSHAIEVAVVVSIVLHIGFVFMFSRATPPRSSYCDLQEVTFMDVTYRPEVAQVLSKITPGGGGSADASEAPTYASGIASEEVAALDLSATLERSQSQAKIDLDRYELDRSGSMDIIRLGGEGSNKSTEEILAQPKVALARGPARGGAGGPPGLTGYPGVRAPEAQLTIEHRPLAKAPARELPEMSTENLPTVSGPVTSGTQFMVAGPISQRKITNKVVPRYPAWALQRRISGSVVVRLWVMPNGKVKGVPTVESSSGYPDLDQVVVNALKAWEFAPLEPGVKAEDQWGLITFRFTLS